MEQITTRTAIRCMSFLSALTDLVLVVATKQLQHQVTYRCTASTCQAAAAGARQEFTPRLA
jgi:hypothetical protein